MAHDTCTEPGCETSRRTRTSPYCHTHYTRRRRAGLVEPRTRKTCRECGRPASGYGLCQTHYMRVRRADVTRPRCAENGCDRIVDSRGFCGYHYMTNCIPEWLRENRNRPDVRDRVRQWQRANPERMAELKRQWKAANRELVRDAARRHSGIRRARIYGAEYEDVDFAALLVEHGMVCHICGGQIDKDLEWDHVIPLARGGTHTNDNLRPSHALCNRSKGARLTA